MFKKFKFWSDSRPEAIQKLHPDLGLRDWDELSHEGKEKIWHHMKEYFSGDESKLRKYFAIYCMNENHKYRSYGENFLHKHSQENASIDFESIFLNHEKNQHVVFELLSCFSRAILVERHDKPKYQIKGETDEVYEERVTEWRYEKFDQFADRLNDVFEQFGVNVVLSRHGFIPKQEQEIDQKIYKPVLRFLSNEKWEPVSRDLKDAFRDFRQKTDSGYSSCVTHSVAAIEAFLQILIYGKTGKNTLSNLITEAQNKELIPNDKFSTQIFKNMESIFAQERKETGDAHPKKEYANEKNTLMVLNLSMIFLQHCILHQK